MIRVYEALDITKIVSSKLVMPLLLLLSGVVAAAVAAAAAPTWTMFLLVGVADS
jgi:hypothetical protein